MDSLSPPLFRVRVPVHLRRVCRVLDRDALSQVKVPVLLGGGGEAIEDFVELVIHVAVERARGVK